MELYSKTLQATILFFYSQLVVIIHNTKPYNKVLVPSSIRFADSLLKLRRRFLISAALNSDALQYSMQYTVRQES